MDKILQNIIMFHYGTCIDDTVGADPRTGIDPRMRHHNSARPDYHIYTDLCRGVYRRIPWTRDFL